MTPAPVRRRRALLVRACALVIVLVVTTTAAEIEIRLLVGTPRPERLPLARVVPHPELGWTMMPGDLHYTYDIPVKLNALGFRGPEVGAKAATEYRIVALGDSHVYGQGVADADLATALIERHYRQPPWSCDVRVVNLGVRAYSINQEYAALRLLGRTLANGDVEVLPLATPHHRHTDCVARVFHILNPAAQINATADIPKVRTNTGGTRN